MVYKKIVVLFMLLLLIGLFSVPCGAENAEGKEGIAKDVDATAFDLGEFWNQEVMPLVVAYGIPGVLFLIETLPILLRVKKSGERFEVSSENVNKMLESTIQREERLREEREAFEALFQEKLAESDARERLFEEKILLQQEEMREVLTRMIEIANGYGEQLASSEHRLSDELQHIEKSADKTERMVLLGFTNSSELVEKGIAHSINKVEEQDDA